MKLPRLRFALPIAMLFMASIALAETRSTSGDAEIQENGSVRFTVQGKFHSNLNDARHSALLAAQQRLREWLAKQDPPIRHVPTLDVIRREMLRQQSAPQEGEALNETQYRIEMTVEMQPSHIRALRSRDRTSSGVWLLGGALAILVVVGLFFRIDEWTKGFLTRWLIAGGVAIIAGLIAALILGR
jgi:hypothetical protein